MPKKKRPKIRPENRIATPHDLYIRAMMSYPQVSKEFFEANLPQHIKEITDFDSIALQKESYIDNELRDQIVDLLYAVNFNGKPGYIYLLLEHASKPDRFLPFRMLKYTVAAMDDHLKKPKVKELPIIYPFILYTGKRPFRHSMDLFDLFGEQKALAKKLFIAPYHLIDLTQVSDEELEKYLWFGTVARVAKHIHDSDIIPFVKAELTKTWNVIEESGEIDYICKMVTYIYRVGKGDKSELTKILITTDLESTKEENMMRIMDQIKQEAWVEFKHLNPQLFDKVKQEAKDETLHDVALNLIRLQMSAEKISEATGLSVQEIEALKMQIN